jgi:hypothetical protein
MILRHSTARSVSPGIVCILNGDDDDADEAVSDLSLHSIASPAPNPPSPAAARFYDTGLRSKTLTFRVMGTTGVLLIVLFCLMSVHRTQLFGWFLQDTRISMHFSLWLVCRVLFLVVDRVV